MQSAKKRCNVVCLRSFQGEAGYFVLNLLKSVLKAVKPKVLGASEKEGIAIVQL